MTTRYSSVSQRDVRLRALRSAIAATSPELGTDYDVETQEWLNADLGV